MTTACGIHAVRLTTNFYPFWNELCLSSTPNISTRWNNGWDYMLRFGKVTQWLSLCLLSKGCICSLKVCMIPAYMCTMLIMNRVRSGISG